MKTTICFASGMFAQCVDFCLELDKRCFPREMWMDDREVNELIAAGALATTVTYNGMTVGLSITMAENDAYALLSDGDQKFKPHEYGAYSYSEAIDPDYQKRGIGTLLLKETEIFLCEHGYKTMSAHVRRKNGWDMTRQAVLSVISSRQVPGFWPDQLNEPVMYQQATLLGLV